MTQSVSEPKLVEQDNAYRQYVDTLSRMNQIVAIMRDEQPVQQQPPTDDSSVITHVTFPPEGGALTYLARYDEPFRGFPLHDTVQSIDELKKLAKIILQKFLPYIKRASLWRKFTLLLALPHLTKLAECYLLAYHWHVKRYRLKPYMYCQSLRELWDTINRAKEIENEELREAIRDLMCMFLEFDNAYRFRFQDIVSELDKAALKKNTTKEILRLIDLLIEREVWEEGKTRMADKWKMMRELVHLFLLISPQKRRAIRDIILRADIEKIKPTKEDRYYCEFRKDYKFGFMIKENIPIRPVPKSPLINVDNTIEVKQ